MASLIKMLDPTLPGTAAEKFHSSLERLVIGQSDAVRQVVELFQTWSAGLSSSHKPIGNLLFLGPTGTGKTRLVEAVAESLVGDPRAVLKIDCAEFQHSHEIAKLIGCFVPTTQILMADGTTKSIKDVVIGDRVICGDGVMRPVLDTHLYDYDGPVNKLSIASHTEPLIGTPEHGILSVKNPSNGKRNRKLSALYDPELLAKNELQTLIKKDIVVWPRWKNGCREAPVIDLAEYASMLMDPIIEAEWVSPRGKLVNKIKRFITVDEKFCRIAGYYVAEGGVTKSQNDYSGVNFTMGVPTKQAALDDLKLIFGEVFGTDASVCEQDRSEDGSIRLYMFSQVLGKFFEDIFGRSPSTKHIPEWFLYLPDNLLWNFLDAALMGDGGRTEARRFDYSTTSKDLHWQINTIFRSRLGVTTQVQTHESTNPKWATRYRSYVAGAQIEWVCAKLPMFGKIIDLVGDQKRANQGIQRGSFVDDDFVYFQVDGNEIIHYKGPVHDISVSEDPDNQWYVAGGVRVRNSPPGYLGHRETHPLLSQETLNLHHTDSIKVSFVLFDEVEKASNALWNLLLGILDKATLTLGDNRKVDFSKAMIFMTSNLGAADMSKILNPGLGFTPVLSKIGSEERIKSAGLSGARRNFTPEFMNRLDKIIVFNSLNENDMSRILSLELHAVQQRIFASTAPPFVIQVTDHARKFILDNGIDDKYGARYLKRTIERLLVNPLANLISSNQVKGGDLVEAGLDSAGKMLTFCRLGENIPAHKMVNEIINQNRNGVEDDPSGKGNQISTQPSLVEPERRVIPFVRRGSPQRTARKRIKNDDGKLYPAP